MKPQKTLQRQQPTTINQPKPASIKPSGSIDQPKPPHPRLRQPTITEKATALNPPKSSPHTHAAWFQHKPPHPRCPPLIQALAPKPKPNATKRERKRNREVSETRVKAKRERGDILNIILLLFFTYHRLSTDSIKSSERKIDQWPTERSSRARRHKSSVERVGSDGWFRVSSTPEISKPKTKNSNSKPKTQTKMKSKLEQSFQKKT